MEVQRQDQNEPEVCSDLDTDGSGSQTKPSQTSGLKKSTHFRSVVTFIALSSLTAVCALMIKMSTDPTLGFVLTTYDQMLVSALMTLVALSIVFRIHKPTIAKIRRKEIQKNDASKLYLIMLPMVVLNSLLLAKVVSVMLIGHVVTMQLMLLLSLSIIPLMLLAPVVIADIFPRLAYLLPRLAGVLLLIAAVAVGLAVLVGGAAAVIAAILSAVGIVASATVAGMAASIATVAAVAAIGITGLVAAIAVALALLTAACAVAVTYQLVGGTVLATVEGTSHVAALASHQLGFREDAPDFNEGFADTSQWCDLEHPANEWMGNLRDALAGGGG